MIDVEMMTAAGGATSEGFADVNGTRLYYETRGSGPALLFAHGFSLDRRMWRHQIEVLSPRYRTIAYDVRGFGRSSMPEAEPYKHCDDAAALCQHLGIDRVVAVGHSIGALYTLELAISRPELVVGWGGICTSGLGGIPFPEEVLSMQSAIRKVANKRGVRAAKQVWQQSTWMASGRDVPALTTDLDRILDDYSGWHWTHENPVRNIVPPANDRLTTLRIPALVVTGGRDLPYNDAVAEVLVRRIPGISALRLPNAGHFANMEDAEAVNRALGELADRAFAEAPRP